MATTPNYQANADGTLVKEIDPPLMPFADQCAVIIEGFKQRQWDVEVAVENAEKRLLRLKVNRGDKKFDLHIFTFSNFAWGNRPKREYEKRIQLSRAYDEHKTEFEMDEAGEERCLLFGSYRRDGKTIIAAWRPANYLNHGVNGACWGDIHSVADAMRSGFGQYKDSKGRVACAFQPDLLPFYVENMNALHSGLLTEREPGDIPDYQDEEREDETNDVIGVVPNIDPIDLPRNRILYGAPGTGKSHQLGEEINKYFGDELLHERVTFHPDYTYGQFVGAYRPVPIYREGLDKLLAADKKTEAGKLEPLIDYAFVPGPFLRLLVLALKNPDHRFVLVIEELNRANAPAVFGEVFQLLDRDHQGVGKFPVVMATEARDYLRSHDLSPSVRLPANLYLWATMNSADQGVMPLDAAFKRRWTFEYVPLNASEAVTAGWMIHLAFLRGSVPWNAFRAAINDHLRKRDVPEDRLLGPFFMRQEELASAQAFSNKLLLYLRDDVVRHNPEALFKGASLSYGALAEAYARGEAIFADGIDFGAVDQGG